MSSDSSAISHPDSDGESYSGWVGRVVDGRYRIDGLLGEGGMGAVFEAEHLKLLKQVALKVIHPEFAGDGEGAERFAREAMASAQMDHPHIAGAIDYGTLAEGGAYLVMQFVRGVSLREAIEGDGALGWVGACEVGAQIADALSAAHKRKIVHRDLKPDNVMLEPRDDGSTLVKVLDFGIARVADEKIATGGPALTRVGTVIGTPGYMAPEQALGEPVDYRVDIYALGLVLFEMVTGDKLYDLDDLTAIVTRQLTEDAPRVSERAPDVPADLDDLIAAMLTKDRDGRPGSVGEVRDALKALLLNATLQRVASGEHALPMLSATELAGAARDPTPLRVELQSEVAAPAVAAAKPSAAKASDQGAKEAAAHAPTALPSRAERRAAATARTQLSREGATSPISAAARIPFGARIAAGCVGLVMMVTVLGSVLLFAFGGEDLSEIVKREHSGGTVVVVDDEPAAEPEPAPDAPTPIPGELLQANADLLVSDRSATRRRAARTVLRYEPREAVPVYLVTIAQLEQARRCESRKQRVIQLQELGDLRALPVLERLADAPRNGCGNVFRRYDCHRCMRDELDAAIEALRASM
ncbi:MAG: serine/threonine-protein kinase [Sandaracinaceae bacterium]